MCGETPNIMFKEKQMYEVMRANHRTPTMDYQSTKHVWDDHPTKKGAPAVLELPVVSASIGNTNEIRHPKDLQP